jgi:hypothetical protein
MVYRALKYSLVEDSKILIPDCCNQGKTENVKQNQNQCFKEREADIWAEKKK